MLELKTRNLENRKEDFVISVAIRRHAKDSPDEPLVLECDRCKVYLPEKVTDPVLLAFHLDNEQYRSLTASPMWRFSIDGTENYIPRDRIGGVSAKNVYQVSLSATSWSPEMIEAKLVAEPLDFKRERLWPHANSKESIKTHGTYWVTPNHLLSPAQSIRRSDTGEVEVETMWKVDVTIDSVPLTFAKHFHYRDGENETASWSELVAEYDLPGKAQTFEEAHRLLAELDDLLRFSSLAARNSCVCLGFEVGTNEGYVVEYYRRDVSIPALKYDRHNELIDTSNIQEFLTSCYLKFIELERDDLIRQAINYTILKQERTVESSFIGLYQALETLVLYYQRKAQLEKIFSEDEKWKQLKGDLKQFLREHELVKEDTIKRGRLYAQLGALERVAFKEGFGELCKYYEVDLSDLWPVLGHDRDWPLKSIRNKLVHGEYFNSAQRHAISTALSHLQWTVERFLLAILGWDVSRSKVDSAYLSTAMNDHKNWKTDIQILRAQ